MGDPVTLSALGHVDHHIRGMGFSVTSTTSRDFFVCGVAISARDVGVLCRAPLEQCVYVPVTPGANGVCRVCGIRDLRWLVDRVA